VSHHGTNEHHVQWASASDVQEYQGTWREALKMTDKNFTVDVIFGCLMLCVWLNNIANRLSEIAEILRSIIKGSK
jgi:hypothetical protein